MSIKATADHPRYGRRYRKTRAAKQQGEREFGDEQRLDHGDPTDGQRRGLRAEAHDHSADAAEPCGTPAQARSNPTERAASSGSSRAAWRCRTVERALTRAANSTRVTPAVSGPTSGISGTRRAVESWHAVTVVKRARRDGARRPGHPDGSVTASGQHAAQVVRHERVTMARAGDRTEGDAARAGGLSEACPERRAPALLGRRTVSEPPTSAAARRGASRGVVPVGPGASKPPGLAVPPGRGVAASLARGSQASSVRRIQRRQ